MIFKGVREGKPYPEHGLTYRDWSQIPPRQIRLDELVTTTTVLALDRFVGRRGHARIVVIVTYHLGQLLMVIGALR